MRPDRTLPALPGSDGCSSAAAIVSVVGGAAKNDEHGVLGAVKDSKRAREIALISGRRVPKTSPQRLSRSKMPRLRPRRRVDGPPSLPRSTDGYRWIFH